MFGKLTLFTFLQNIWKEKYYFHVSMWNMKQEPVGN